MGSLIADVSPVAPGFLETGAEAPGHALKREAPYRAAGAAEIERRPETKRTPSASVCSSWLVPAGTLQESPGPYVTRSLPKTRVMDPSSTNRRASNPWACASRCTLG